MALLKLTVNKFRNLESQNLLFNENLNFVIGDNGSGKSSLLEAIFYLGHAKSFRTTKLENLVCFDEAKFVVSAQDNKQQRLGIERDFLTGQVNVKIDSIKESRLSVLAKHIAVQIITPESFKLFSGGPRERRKFVDLGLFHVEQSFSKIWQQFNRALKQRNACLRSAQSFSQQEQFWRKEFVLYSEQVAVMRSDYISLLKSELDNWLDILLPEISGKISIQYLQGWNSKKCLSDVLEESIEKEYERSFSLFGAHKFDIRFLFNKKSIDVALSRGQQKLFLLALTFSQTKLIERVNRVKPILLIDDIGAELDVESRSAFKRAVDSLNCQIIVTAIEESSLTPILPKDKNYNMFHVKHGKISVMSK